VVELLSRVESEPSLQPQLPAQTEPRTDSIPATSSADSVVSAAFKDHIDTNNQSTQAPEAVRSTFQSLAVPGASIAGLALFAAFLKKRKHVNSAHIQIVETTMLGPKRSLVVADVMGERWVLGMSEAGMTVLSSRPAPAPEPQTIVMPSVERLPRASPRDVSRAHRTSNQGFLSRLFARKTSQLDFEQELQESMEDIELRAKLAAGMRGTIS
jgi:flagellar biogenesis protein FliO